MKVDFSKLTILTVAAGMAMLQAVPAHAGACKGMDEDTCSTSAACRWVDAYQRSDGREIRGYCRTRPAKRNVELDMKGEKDDA